MNSFFSNFKFVKYNKMKIMVEIIITKVKYLRHWEQRLTYSGNAVKV